MSFEERLAQTQAKMEELQAKINEFVSDPDALNKVFDNIDNKLATKIVEGMDAAGDAIDAAGDTVGGLDGKIDDAIKTGAENYDKAASKFQAKVDNAIETADGDYYAAKESARIAKEDYEGSLNSDLIQIQMNMEEVKAKIKAKRDSVDKAVQQELINDLLDYADDCQALALAYTEEAMSAVKDASELMEEYDAKYGKTE